jgi:branched-chain amino acid transport system permease protein
VRAGGADPDTVATLGIHPQLVRAATVAGGSALAMTAGVLAAPLLGLAPGLAHQALLLALVVAIAGRPGSIGGALVAALAVGQVQTTAVVALPTLAPYLAYLLLVAALVARGVHAQRRTGAR